MGNHGRAIGREGNRFGLDGRNWPSWKRRCYNRRQRLRIFATDVGLPVRKRKDPPCVCTTRKGSYRLLGGRRRVLGDLRMQDPSSKDSKIPRIQEDTNLELQSSEIQESERCKSEIKIQTFNNPIIYSSQHAEIKEFSLRTNNYKFLRDF